MPDTLFLRLLLTASKIVLWVIKLATYLLYFGQASDNNHLQTDNTSKYFGHCNNKIANIAENCGQCYNTISQYSIIFETIFNNTGQ